MKRERIELATFSGDFRTRGGKTVHLVLDVVGTDNSRRPEYNIYAVKLTPKETELVAKGELELEDIPGIGSRRLNKPIDAENQ